jgi:hypothetical protein
VDPSRIDAGNHRYLLILRTLLLFLLLCKDKTKTDPLQTITDLYKKSPLQKAHKNPVRFCYTIGRTDFMPRQGYAAPKKIFSEKIFHKWRLMHKEN